MIIYICVCAVRIHLWCHCFPFNWDTCCFYCWLFPHSIFFFWFLCKAFDNFCKIAFLVSFVFSNSLFIRVVEKFTPHIICDNCRLRSYRLFSLYQICSVFQTVFPFECMWFSVMWTLSFVRGKFVVFSIWVKFCALCFTRFFHGMRTRHFISSLIFAFMCRILIFFSALNRFHSVVALTFICLTSKW